MHDDEENHLVGVVQDDLVIEFFADGSLGRYTLSETTVAGMDLIMAVEEDLVVSSVVKSSGHRLKGCRTNAVGNTPLSERTRVILDSKSAGL